MLEAFLQVLPTLALVEFFGGLGLFIASLIAITIFMTLPPSGREADEAEMDEGGALV